MEVFRSSLLVQWYKLCRYGVTVRMVVRYNADSYVFPKVAV